MSVRAHHNLIRPHWLGNILNFPWAHILVYKIEPLTNGGTYRLGDTDTSGLRQRLQTGRYVDSVAVDVPSVLDYVAGINANAKFDLAFAGQDLISDLEFALNGNGA